jgi:hypothetical protein
MRFRIQIFEGLNKVGNKVIFTLLSHKLKKVNTVAYFAEFKYVLVLCYHARVLSDSQFHFDENLYLLFITDSKYIT